MGYLLDTDVVIHLRDGDLWVADKVDELRAPLFVSAITRVELENGIWRDPVDAAVRRVAMEIILTKLSVIDFGTAEIAAYGGIVAATGFSRRKIGDRMTAATALVAGLSLITFNGQDFRDVPGLDLIEWQRPEA